MLSVLINNKGKGYKTIVALRGVVPQSVGHPRDANNDISEGDHNSTIGKNKL